VREKGSGVRGVTSNFSVAFRKSGFDEFLLIVLEVLGERP